MRQLKVYFKQHFAGTLSQLQDKSYIFEYDAVYFSNQELPAISLTLPKTKRQYVSQLLFPFFFHIMAEGANKLLQTVSLKIDENDYFSLLANTTAVDTIGAVTLKPMRHD